MYEFKSRDFDIYDINDLKLCEHAYQQLSRTLFSVVYESYILLEYMDSLLFVFVLNGKYILIKNNYTVSISLLLIDLCPFGLKGLKLNMTIGA